MRVFFESRILPRVGPPLAGFGRYFGARKLDSGATFWPSLGPWGPQKRPEKKPKRILKNPLTIRISLSAFAISACSARRLSPPVSPERQRQSAERTAGSSAEVVRVWGDPHVRRGAGAAAAPPGSRRGSVGVPKRQEFLKQRGNSFFVFKNCFKSCL